MNLSLDDSISAQLPDPTPDVTPTGFATVPTPIPTPVPAPIPSPAYEVNLSEAAQSNPTKLGVKLSLKLL
jgi:hypothetical protein